MIQKLIYIWCLFFLVFPFEQNKQQRIKQIYGDLQLIQNRIQSKIKRDHYARFKFSRLNQNIIKNIQNVTLNEIQLMASINIHYKDNLYHSIMLKQRENYYTLRGDLLYQNINQNNQIVKCSSSRNEHTIFGKLYRNKTLKIERLKNSFKKSSLQHEIDLDLNQIQYKTFDDFIYYSLGSNRIFIISFDKNSIYYFDRYGKFMSRINIQGEIINMQKISQNLIVLTNKQLFYLSIAKNSTKTNCLMPFDKIKSFKYDQSNFKYFYARNSHNLLKYQLGQTCRPIQSYSLQSTAQFNIASQIIFIQNKGYNFALNLSDNTLKPYILPINKCKGQSKLSMNKKNQHNYIISQLCVNEENVNITNIIVQFQVEQQQFADFSKFRIPFLLLSFGIIIYVTIKNKKKQNQPKQKQIEQQKLLKTILQMKAQKQMQQKQIKQLQKSSQIKQLTKSKKQQQIITTKNNNKQIQKHKQQTKKRKNK